MKSIKYLALLFALIAFTACQDDVEPVERPKQQPIFKDMSLNEVKGLGNHLARYIGSSTFYNALDLDRVRIKSDSSQFVNHTVYLDDYDGDPYTFNNLVIGKDSLGNYQPPYILRYEPTDAFRRAYFNTGLLIGFEGKIIKYTLGVSGADGIKLRPPNHDPTEGDDGPGENNNPVNDVNVVCEKVISNTGGGAPSGGDDGRNSYMVCETILHWSQYGDSDGNIHMYGFFTTQECTIRSINEYSAAGNNDCSEQNKGDVPVLDKAPLRRFKYPEGSDYEKKYPKLTEYLKNQLPNVLDNQRIIQIIQYYTNMSYEEISKQISWGSGPTIIVQ
ncbi:hypothetical protein GBO34_15230 [Roseivirga pacifica]|nr:hypothetical protein [Roseivirga pacifica]MCO6367150.1 hypothetical protein [Roseivirga pacifica]MCO6370318.1 hypothetical protein [Roseivirga pacifica]MCO6374807.1 hypothetical protein [Roseivirga pacifica]MCO6380065.1 hypothetical protein [Roseivirga pacifica]